MKLLTTCILLISAILAKGQDAHLFLGGNLSYGSVFKTNRNQSESNNDALNFNAYIGLPHGNNWMMAIRGGFLQEEKDGQVGPNLTSFTFTETTYTLGIFARRYFRAEMPLRFFLEPAISYSKYRYKNPSPPMFTDTIDKEVTKYAGISPGMQWHFSKRLSLLCQFGKIGYTTGKRRSSISGEYTKRHDFQTAMNMESFAVGIELKL